MLVKAKVFFLFFLCFSLLGCIENKEAFKANFTRPLIKISGIPTQTFLGTTYINEASSLEYTLTVTFVGARFFIGDDGEYSGRKVSI